MSLRQNLGLNYELPISRIYVKTERVLVVSHIICFIEIPNWRDRFQTFQKEVGVFKLYIQVGYRHQATSREADLQMQHLQQVLQN
jgi:hypothetical protein